MQYLHSEVQTMERIEILRDLRLGMYDVVVGINLLREGLDLPEVSLVAILDADKEGFLRSKTSLVQTIGRAARHVEGKVILYADKITDSMAFAIGETDRRRAIQVAYNTEHGIEPQSIAKSIRDLTDRVKSEVETEYDEKQPRGLAVRDMPKDELAKVISTLEGEMKAAAKDLEFEKAAMLRDQVMELRQQLLDIDDKTPEWEKARKMGDMAEGDFADVDTNGNGKTRNGTTAAKVNVEYVIKKPAKGKPGRARERSRK